MDLSTIESVLGLATTALGATGKAVSTVEAVKKLLKSEKRIAKGDNSEANGEVQTLLNTLATELTAANMMNVQLSEAIKTLIRELKSQDDFENEKSRYELFQTGQQDIVFRLKADQADSQPAHYACPVCLNRDKLISFITGQGDYRLCQTNSSHTFRFHDTPVRQPNRAHTDWSPF
ncbi:MAG: hypothetical protein E5V91_19950 [Mesorhizobium sp.]|uniref:hypothetical protein n=1 Tax=Mesorhizobium sp. M2D.F.Ca.ET.233.01.1.1 TaxID=2563943 RepID=UPI001093C1AF|nr:hypothetical protein [Mesorhizobium sp. M2D.F.Ca.ET.233.01.1.1]TGP14619.1 hypothetical protein EN876_25645 [Mesorhizobium sp. M2D.F.Ca.ET.233.01.1.1]TGV66816.1 hypothetical protein EN803_25130 [Mesorhizobium sp. M2D.F.Ca.ET.160.01.1.1]TIV37045.1 MAG: hypothetical protein E5V91_19950 [Mesorhizobium sp.]